MIALITGASAGIGRELALRFAGRGYGVVLVARDEARLAAVKQEIASRHGVTATVLCADLADPAAPGRIAAACREQRLEIDVLVNNAGFGTVGPFHSTDHSREADLVQVNVTALVRLTSHFLPAMVGRRRGGVLNVASTAGFQAGPNMAGYYASKAYVVSFTEALAVELRGTGVTASVLCPGPTRTEFQHRAGMSQTGVTIARDFVLMDAAVVADAGIRGFLRGTTIILPGWHNRLGVLAVKFLPRAFTRRVVAELNRPRHAGP
jgi:short-subunit dehydrogenase